MNFIRRRLAPLIVFTGLVLGGCVRFDVAAQAEMTAALAGTQEVIEGCSTFYALQGRWPATKEEILLGFERNGQKAQVLPGIRKDGVEITRDGASAIYRLTTERGGVIRVRMNPGDGRTPSPGTRRIEPRP